MIKLRFDFTKHPPQIDINRDNMTRDDIHLLRTTFFQMSQGKKFLKKFILEIRGLDLKITPETTEYLQDITKAQNVFKNLTKDAALAYRDFN